MLLSRLPSALPRVGAAPTSASFSTSPAATGKVFVTEGKRTPFGKFGGSLMNMTPNELAIHAAKASLASAKIDPTHIDHVVYANVVNSTPDTIYGSRHTGLHVGAKIETPAYNVNRLCGSGIQAIVDAKNMIQRGEAEVVLVVGSESMSGIPHATYGTRFGTRYQSYKVVDFLMDALTDQYCGQPMAITAEDLGAKYEITRGQVDDFSLQSHQRATASAEHLAGEIAPIELKRKTVSEDEHVRREANIGDMNKLKSVFQKDGLVTAASASGIVDGAASTLVVSEAYAKKHGIKLLAEVGESSVVGVDPKLMGFGPVPAIRKVLEKTGLTLDQIDLVEINEAFAAQVLACAKELNLSVDKLNIWGGATAIGHPLGASGVRIANTLGRQLKATGKKQGIASACIGGGQGIALQLTAVEE